MISGYARVSDGESSLDGQIETLTSAGAERIWTETAPGRGRGRPELGRLIDSLGPDDVLLVTRYDRLSRSLLELTSIVGRVREQGADFRSLAEEIDTTAPSGGVVFHVFGTIGRFERDRISERTREGLAAARKLGRTGGRPPALDPQQRAEVRRMRDVEGRRIAEIARLFKVSANTVRRA